MNWNSLAVENDDGPCRENKRRQQQPHLTMHTNPSLHQHSRTQLGHSDDEGVDQNGMEHIHDVQLNHEDVDDDGPAKMR